MDPAAQHDMLHNDVSTSTVAIVGLLGALLTFVVIVLLMVVYYTVADREEYRKVISQPMVEISTLKSEQLGRLTEYRWADQKSRTAAIPIDRAMEIVVSEIRAGTWQAPPGTADSPTPGAPAAAGGQAPGAPAATGQAVPHGSNPPGGESAAGKTEPPAETAKPGTGAPAGERPDAAPPNESPEPPAAKPPVAR